MSFHPSIRVRIVLWFVAVLAVILAVFSAGIYFFLSKDLNDNLDDSLRSRAGVLLNVVAVPDGRPTLTGLLPGDDASDRETYARTFDQAGNVVFDTSSKVGTLPVDSVTLDAALAGRSIFQTIEEPALRVHMVPIRRDGAIVGALEVGQSRDDVLDTLGILLYVTGIAYPVTLIGATAGGLFLASRALSPIDRLTRQAQRISAENLDEHLNLTLPDDEVGRLARTFDAMLARLADAFARQRRFTADASHELRTPLTVLKGQLDVALNRQRDATAYRQVLVTANNEVDHMIRLVGGLLTMARTDANEVSITKERIDLGGLVYSAVEQVRPTAEAAGVNLNLATGPAITLNADEDLLLQLLLNLFDNALKHTSAGGNIDVGWQAEGDHVLLFVSDTGTGIAQEHLPFLFDRFYRVERERGRSDGGAGLGLAICQWIVQVHGGSIGVTSEPEIGSRFEVQLPLTDTARH